jgi:hypothetical protein
MYILTATNCAQTVALKAACSLALNGSFSESEGSSTTPYTGLMTADPKKKVKLSS